MRVCRGGPISSACGNIAGSILIIGDFYGWRGNAGERGVKTRERAWIPRTAFRRDEGERAGFPERSPASQGTGKWSSEPVDVTGPVKIFKKEILRNQENNQRAKIFIECR